MNARILVVRTSDRQDRVSPAESIVIQVPQSDTASFQDVVDRLHLALRSPSTPIEHVVLGKVTVDFLRRRVVSPCAAIHLTAQEFELLRYLAGRRGAVVSRDELLRDVWKYADTPMTRSVDNAVARLRKKIEPCPQKPMFLHTVHGDGYCLTAADDRAAAEPA